MNQKNYFFKTFVVLDSDEESEIECSINAQGPNNIHYKRSLNASNRIYKEKRNINSGRVIRDDPLWLNINVPENFNNLNDSTIYTPRTDKQIENVKTLPTNSDLIKWQSITRLVYYFGT